jgi:chorismate synthase
MSNANLFGERFSILTFGESHGPAMGVVIDGMPAGVLFDEALLQHRMQRRKPGANAWVSARQEPDEVEILSGVFEGKTLGTPIAAIVRNQDARSDDYKNLRPRSGHADDVWKKKFAHSDPRGGGRSSGRETLSRVIAGAFAEMLCRQLYPQIRVLGFAERIGPYQLQVGDLVTLEQEISMEFVDRFVARFPTKVQSPLVESLLLQAKEQGKSYGGVAELWMEGIPPSLGQPVFHKLKADLASAMLGLGATNGLEFGDGFKAVQAEGSEFHTRDSVDQYGGIRGGISTGERISMKVAFKPTSSVLDVAKKGRHDPCIVPRAIPVLESMAWLVLADHILWMRSDRVVS